MSPREAHWFLAGTGCGLVIGALGVYFLLAPASSRAPAATMAGSPAASSNTTDLLMPGDRWPSLADADSTGVLTAPGDSGAAPRSSAASNASAGSLADVTRKLAQRLSTQGGTDDEWRLLAQSYEYMGRKNDAHAARNHAGSPDTAPEAKVTSAPATQPAVGKQEPSRIFGTVQISDELAAAAAPGTTLFVYATQTGEAGPPLAVLRLRVDRWPMSFILDDADAMIPGRNLSGSKHIQLEARISPSGEALPQAGDLVGTLRDIDPHTRQPVNIAITHKIT